MSGSVRRVFAAVACCVVVPLQAQTLSDPQWEALLEAQRFVELDKLAQARLQAQPDDPQATLAVALVAMSSDDPARVESALQLADKSRPRRCATTPPPACGACRR